MGTERNEDGTFKPGFGGYSTGKRRYVQDIRKAFEEMLPPAELAQRWQQAWTAAARHDAAKAMVTLLEFALNYTVGKPKQTLEIGAGDNQALLLALLQDRTPVLPPRQGIIVDTETPLASPNTAPRLGLVDTTIDYENDNSQKLSDDDDGTGHDVENSESE